MGSGTDWHWHARAWMARKRWAATRERVAQALLSLRQVGNAAQELLLLGGSAGWMMSPEFLAGFQRVVLVDMDPWAPRLFRFNHGPVLTRHGVVLDFWQGDAHELLDRALAAHPQACVLFDNFLGLDSIHSRSVARTEKRMRGLRRRVKGRLWGSVHDRLSGPGTPQWAGAACWLQDWPACSAEPLPQQAMFSAVQAKGEWLDHHTAEVLPPGVRTQLIPWPIVPGRWHWLEAGWVDDRHSP
jgi:hypothetical protein